MSDDDITADLGPPQPALHVRPANVDEYPWFIHSWSEGYKASPNMKRKTWRDYKALDVPVLRGALSRPDTQVLVAAGPDDRGMGWLAFARWPSIDVVHWAYVVMEHRGHGVLRLLLEAAQLRARVVHTHKAPIRRTKQRADISITAALRAQGKVVSHIPYAEWSR